MTKAIETSGLDKNTFESLFPGVPDNIIFHDGKDDVFPIFGTRVENGKYVREYIRMGREYNCDDAVDSLRNITSGVRFRFSSETLNLAILCKTFPIASFNERYGVDVRVTYSDGCVQTRHVQRSKSQDFPGVKIDSDNFRFENVASCFCAENVKLAPGKKNIEIMLPHYAHVEYFKIGIDAGATVEEFPHKITKPVVFLGSSITQGIRACRPATTYEQQVSQMLDCDYINLGFSGSCRVQQPIIDYIKTLENMSVFVYDYDHNAPTVDFLAETHEKAFLQIREKFPMLPIIIMTKPDFRADPLSSAKRREVIHTTYKNAVERGDENVWFVDGEQIFVKPGVDPNVCTFDGVHPNDLGFWCMATTVAGVLKEIFNKF